MNNHMNNYKCLASEHAEAIVKVDIRVHQYSYTWIFCKYWSNIYIYIYKTCL